jgi:transcriptional regulator with PAS, ATPase and Fis domain
MDRPPRDEATLRRSDPGERPCDAFTLVVIQGRDTGVSTTLDVTSPMAVLVGKSPVCTLRLTDPEVSRRHVSFRALDRSLVIMDLGSTNGTQVNGVSIREAVLRGGETVRVGSTVITVTRGASSVATFVQESAFGRMVGASRAMRALYPVLHRLAAHDEAILLEGESGVGKGLCASEIHAHSARKSGPFVSVSRDAIPAGELEEQLFGEGGLLQEASGGTLFLDEVSGLSTSAHKRLLGALSPGPGAGGARLILGTRFDLDREVTEGRLSAELLAALAPRRVELPPLRHRDGDVPLLAETLWKTLLEGSPSGPAPLPADFLPRYQGYLWPGNVRELWDALQARFYLGEVGARHRERDAWDEPLDSLVSRELPLAKARELAVRSFERRYVEHMLERYGSTREAAKASEVAQRYFRLLVARVGARAGLGAAGAVSPAGSSEAASAEDSPPSGKGPDPA